MRPWRFLLCATLAIVVACEDDPTGPLRDSRGVLLSVRGEANTAEIVAIRPDGSEMRQLTRNGVMDTDPDWSPDGTRIVYVSAQDSFPGAPGRRPDIFVMNEDGSGQRRLLQVPRAAWRPRWSPDGTRIAFESYDPASLGFRVHIMNSDGSNVRIVPSAAGENFFPQWSPDGTRLLFLSNRAPRHWWTMYTVNVDGTGERQLFGNEVCASNVNSIRWSPDGSRIAYMCDAELGSIRTIRTDGTDPQTLTGPDATAPWATDYNPVWSPDGGELAFTSNRYRATPQSTNQWHVFIVSAAGANRRRVTSDTSGHFVHAWGPPR
jgi:Tol biopolymer transport system component